MSHNKRSSCVIILVQKERNSEREKERERERKREGERQRKREGEMKA